MTDPRKACDICGIPGLIGDEVIVTGSGHWVHHGKCHDALIAREIAAIERREAGR